MKDIRKFIAENRDLFDEKEPSAGHMERFEALLKEQEKTGPVEEKEPKKIKIFNIISVAATVAILIGVAVTLYAPQSIEVAPAPANENAISTGEFQATNDYYSQQMEEQIADIMCKLAYTDTNNQAQLTTDIQEIIERNKAFVEEMARNENQEVAIRYLVKNYKTNIQRLENINQKLGKYTKC
ncbi:hypothetical protein [Prevotella sp. 10(H)]|uniref:hypothetical protein n=1 Tax=Prevotella sp. 10(H) TaxID=1158294 RepID=UPI0004A70DBE|nr:hypothetical protein [Prevotella sp. 10(H)]